MRRFLPTSLLALALTLSSGTASADTGPISVGAIMPLSGVTASWGERVRIGLETANDLQGSRLLIRFEDEGACEPQKALTAYRKLVSVDKVKIIFVGCLAGAKAIAPVAAHDSVLLLSLGLLDDEVLASGAKLINLATEIGTEGRFLSQFVLREHAERMAGIFYSDAFGQEFGRALSQELESAGRPLKHRDQADVDTTSFRPLITRWKQAKVDLLITTLSDKQSSILFREMKELGFKPKVYSSYVLEAVVPTPEDRALFEGARYTHPVNAADGSPKNVEIEAALKKRQRPGESSNVNALFAYDGIRFLLEGSKRCDTADTSCLYKYFTGLGEQHGVSGEMHFQTSGALTRPYGLKAVRDGGFVWLERTP